MNVHAPSKAVNPQCLDPEQSIRDLPLSGVIGGGVTFTDELVFHSL